jgi:hypothetical protein
MWGNKKKAVMKQLFYRAVSAARFQQKCDSASHVTSPMM